MKKKLLKYKNWVAGEKKVMEVINFFVSKAMTSLIDNGSLWTLSESEGMAVGDIFDFVLCSI